MAVMRLQNIDIIDIVSSNGKFDWLLFVTPYVKYFIMFRMRTNNTKHKRSSTEMMVEKCGKTLENEVIKMGTENQSCSRALNVQRDLHSLHTIHRTKRSYSDWTQINTPFSARRIPNFVVFTRRCGMLANKSIIYNDKEANNVKKCHNSA